MRCVGRVLRLFIILLFNRFSGWYKYLSIFPFDNIRDINISLLFVIILKNMLFVIILKNKKFAGFYCFAFLPVESNSVLRFLTGAILLIAYQQPSSFPPSKADIIPTITFLTKFPP